MKINAARSGLELSTCAVKLRNKKMWFSVPNETALARAKTILTKEPCTIEWLDSFQPNSIMIDVGANVGMYSVYAAVMNGTKVYAFEPESQNFSLLCQNIFLNKLDEQIHAWPAAISDSATWSYLHLSQFMPAGSCHSFGENLDPYLKQREHAFKQGAIATRLDWLVSQEIVPQPHYIKIDVDGLEHKVIAGIQPLIEHPDFRSLLIELNPAVNEHKNTIAFLENLGLRYNTDQVEKAKRQEGYFKDVAEYIFSR
ncbi:MAG: FkbM family methyltransferase [Alphaproteobacteria bacterium]